jgi:TRAP-type uncharacterized transport system fused permease subunit
MMLATTGFIVPFMFVYGPPLLLVGSPLHIAGAVATALVGVVGLASATIGFARRPLRVWERLAMALAACLLIFPGLVTDAIGLAGVAAFMLSRPGEHTGRIVDTQTTGDA